MRKILLFLSIVLVMLFPLIIKADELENITREIESLRKDLAGKEANYQQLNVRLNNIKNRVVILEGEIVKKEVEVKKVMLESRDSGQLGQMSKKDLLAKFLEEIKNKK